MALSSKLRFKSQCLLVAKKAYNVLNMLFRCFKCVSVEIFIRAYCAYVRPLLEYCCIVWSPVYVTEIDIIENVQRHFTLRLFARASIPQCSYPERLTFLKLDSLELRRLRADLYMCYKIVHGDINLQFNDFFEWGLNLERTRGHFLRFRVPVAHTNVLMHKFAHCAVALRNYLLQCIHGEPLVHARNVCLFKKRLKFVDLTRHLRFSRNL